MTISDIKVSAVIKLYLKHLKQKTKQSDSNSEPAETPPYNVHISEKGVKKLLAERTSEALIQKAKKEAGIVPESIEDK
ncbi:MAG: hypothetical protein N2513_00930 [Deltaproteobacteria bacterium]|nr:hypothetical protein [Deltaproteobacteria bacterium]